MLNGNEGVANSTVCEHRKTHKELLRRIYSSSVYFGLQNTQIE